MIAYIYKLTAPNGKIYIGQTIDLKRRYSEYKRSNSRAVKTKIYSSIIHYGWNNFKKETLFKGETTFENINQLEIYYIKKFDSVNSGLNLEGGGFNGLHSEATKLKMSESALKVNSCKEYTKWRNRGWVGRKHTDETKAKMRAGSVNKGSDKETLDSIRESAMVKVRKVVLNTENGVYYDSIIDASKSIGMNYRTFKNKLNGSKPNNTYFIIA